MTTKPIKQDYIVHNPSRLFKDINIAFTRHPISNDVSVKTDDASIKQALRNLILLNSGEKPFHPEIGGGIHDLLFENFDEPGIEETMKYKIATLIAKFEPRVETEKIDMDFNHDNNSVTIGIYYTIINTLTPSNVKIFLKTVR